MCGFEFERTELEDARYIKNFYHEDERGGFMKCFEKNIYAEAGIEFNVSETFISVSAKNVIRGLHFQANSPQSKIISVMHGKAWDVIVDLRPKSITYRKWFGKVLSAQEHNAMYVPRGFAHGFAALEDETIMCYQCDGAYDKGSDMGIRFDDKDIDIKWPINVNQSIISDRDRSLLTFDVWEKAFYKVTSDDEIR